MTEKMAGISILDAVPVDQKVRRWASIDKVDNGYIVTLEATGKKFVNIKLVENKLKKAVGDIIAFMEAIEEKETT